ncbi:GGDEF domain-containing protein [Cognatiyoonia sp. IB215446]|uniref:GGDEF domain-containing protein n=1 Tax=Cognatiyoonia sp. IB215446 TaxID=3097355 RepID=UPI002A0EE420|nr:GGDEF domain-containing protein [Cognatiyoonia sp. IB215446]MDX8348416.1 GGDEF domain-containing protein [Cognatiyoonia sp. IB215446]
MSEMMRFGLETWWGVTIAAVLTTMAAVAVSEALVYLLYTGQDLRAALRVGPLVTIITAFPFCMFVWAQVRKNVHLNTELQRLVDRDRLTDVATRDFFFARMRAEPKAYGISLMIDIDHFKSVNDTHGHLAGDAVISRVAMILRQNTREKDIVCRFGGEEFIVFLHEEGPQAAFHIAERMRKAIADEVVNFDDKALSVTVSIGGSLKEQVADITRAIQQADEALYRAKSAGRNQTVFASAIDETASVSAA